MYRTVLHPVECAGRILLWCVWSIEGRIILWLPVVVSGRVRSITRPCPEIEMGDHGRCLHHHGTENRFCVAAPYSITLYPGGCAGRIPSYCVWPIVGRIIPWLPVVVSDLVRSITRRGCVRSGTIHHTSVSQGRKGWPTKVPAPAARRCGCLVIGTQPSD